MTTDYLKLTRENIREYGEGTRHLAFLGQLYSDRTHFIFELLQNAEDAGASSVRFDLFADRLEFRHDGRRFDENDVIGICSVGNSVKKDDLTQIGRFGVGFKSVYAYCSAPKIYSGDEHFEIESFVRPRAIEKRVLPKGETLFIFPFEHGEISADVAVEEISQRFSSLDHTTLLFLRNVSHVRWNINTADAIKSSALTRTVRAERGLRYVTVRQENKTAKSEWLLFQKPLELDGVSSKSRLYVELAFKLRRDENEELLIAPVDRATLVAFFPTEKETHLGFYIQGPYQTTPARDNVPDNNEFNRIILNQTSELMIDALKRLRSEGLLTPDVLETLPIWPTDFPKHSMFYPLFSALQNAFATESLIPCVGGKYANSNECRIAKRSYLRDLLTEKQLGQLYKSSSIKWVASEISLDSKPRLVAYLRGTLRIEEITPENLTAILDDRFLESQNDDWLIKFYIFLDSQRHLLKKQTPTFLYRRFVRLTDNRMVSPLRADGTPSAFLPKQGMTDAFDMVKPKLLTEDRVKSFFNYIGIKEPDVVAEVKQKIVPIYQDQDRRERLSAELHSANIKKILDAYQSASPIQKESLQDLLADIRFVKARNSKTGELSFKKPAQCYWTSDHLLNAFSSCDVWFIHETKHTCRLLAEAEWAEIGINFGLRLVNCPASLSKEDRSNLRHGERANREIEQLDWTIEGLDDCLQNIRQNVHAANTRCIALWELLVEMVQETPKEKRAALFVSEYQWVNGKTKTAPYPSKFVKELMSAEWIVDKEGQLRKPGQISLTEIAVGLQPCDLLADTLQMRSQTMVEMASELGLDLEVLRFVREHKDEIGHFMNDFLKCSLRRPETQEKSGREQIEKVFNRIERVLQEQEAPDISDPEILVANPELRRQRVREDIIQSREGVIESRIRPSIQRDSKNPVVRQFLKESYQGKCQICDFSFRKLNNEPYFEAVYLVSRLDAVWLDRPGNVLCLCANCAAMFIHGSVESKQFFEHVTSLKLRKEGGGAELTIPLLLCGKEVQLRFSEKHLLELQEVLMLDDKKLARSS